MWEDKNLKLKKNVCIKKQVFYNVALKDNLLLTYT